MTEKKRTYQGVIFSLALAGVVVCALVCGCTSVDQGASATGTPEITESAPSGSEMPQKPPGNGTPGGPDLASAAATLGVTEEELQNALGNGGEGMDLEAAASRLGVTVKELQEALGNPPERQMPQGGGTPPNGTAPGGTPPATPAGR
jgi:hypothetical protein